MANPKIYKIAAVLIVVSIVGSIIFYAQLTNRHKAIVKTVFLHKTGLIDNDWDVTNKNQVYNMTSPSFLIDGIYTSMEGPKSSKYVQLSQDSTLIYITGFEVTAHDAKSGKRISNDFICHTNVDFNDVKYYSNFNLTDRIGRQYPRMTSLSNGMEHFKFPAGYGVPMRGNDLLYVTTQSLNHNHADMLTQIKHKVAIQYTADNNLKPLMSRTVFIMLPFDNANPYKAPVDPGSDFCIPVETKNHTYDDGTGKKLSGHWVVPTGNKTYRSPIDHQLQISDSLRLHAAAIHVHPFATSITLFDKTAQAPVFTSVITNHIDKVGLVKVADFISESGIWLYADHSYELVLEVSNTSGKVQDMMGSMFLFFYDKQLDQIVAKMPLDKKKAPRTEQIF